MLPRQIISAIRVVSCAALVSSTGCIYRSLTIKTNPPGATVYVNDELKGKTPLRYDFTWYGWHRITIRKEGFQRLDDHKLLRAPFYLWIPFDLVTELLPFPIRDERTWSYALTPQKELPSPVPPVLDRQTPPTPTAKPPASKAAPLEFPSETIRSTPSSPAASIDVTAEVSPAAGASAPAEPSNTTTSTTMEPTNESR